MTIKAYYLILCYFIDILSYHFLLAISMLESMALFRTLNQFIESARVDLTQKALSHQCLLKPKSLNSMHFQVIRHP